MAGNKGNTLERKRLFANALIFSALAVGLVALSWVQIPPLRLFFGAENQVVSGFHIDFQGWVTAGVTGIGLIKPVRIMSKGYPYKPARLIIPGAKAKDQRWKIRFSAWDVQAGKLVTRTLHAINSMRFGSVAEKKAFGQQQVAEINQLLRSGYTFGAKSESTENPEPPKPAMPTMEEAAGVFLGEKEVQKPSTQHAYKVALKRFLNNGHAKRPLNQVTSQHVREHLIYLKVNAGLSARSHNNHRSGLRTFFAWAVKRYELPSNPCDETKALAHSPGKNIAYTRPQQRMLIDYMQVQAPAFHHLAMWVYFTLIRTNELSHLRIRDLDRPQPGLVRLEKNITKNGHARAPKIPAALESLIVSRGLRSYPPDWYIFGAMAQPAAKHYPADYLARRYRQHVLKPLGFSTEYTLYSWKHTGVCELYRAGVPRWEIMLQAGWRDSGSFEAYLHSLGLFDEKKIITQYPNPGQF